MARRPGGGSPRGDGGSRTRPGRLQAGAATTPRRAAERPDDPAPERTPDADLVLLGEFGRAQGLNGEVRLKSYTADPKAIAGYGPLTAADGRRIEITDLRPAPGGSPDILVARVRGVSDRTGAEALNRLGLHAPRERLGAIVADDEFYTADLVGLTAVDPAGAPVGTIVAVPNYGGGDLLEIRPAAGGATALLPFTKAFVPDLDIPAGRVVVELPEDFFAPPGERPADEPA